MRDWLKMSGAATSDLDRLEEKTRSFRLSEGQVRDVYPAPVLKALLPVSVATKLKTCVGERSLIMNFVVVLSLSLSLSLLFLSFSLALSLSLSLSSTPLSFSFSPPLALCLQISLSPSLSMSPSPSLSLFLFLSIS